MFHAAQHPLDVRHHVPALDADAGTGRHAQCNMQGRAPFADVDWIAIEQGIDPRRQTACAGQAQQQLDSPRSDPVLGIVQIPARGFHAEARPPLRVKLEQVSQMLRPHVFQVPSQRLPGSGERHVAQTARCLSVHCHPSPCRPTGASRIPSLSAVMPQTMRGVRALAYRAGAHGWSLYGYETN
ncbi:hypothetical protein D3C86_930800 [compost metagenome]